MQSLFLTYFRSLIEHECTVDVELKSGIQVTGTLTFIDNNMCMWLEVDNNQLAKLPPQYAGMKGGLYLRGSAIRAVYMPVIEGDL